MTKRLLLDVFCGAGGCSEGYRRAGFEVIGVDIHPQPRYPYRFIETDALEVLATLRRKWEWMLGSFAAIHASPPCQAFTTMSNRHRGAGGKADDAVDLIAATRSLLEQTGLPYVIENVPGARAQMRSPYVLNGGMFGLRVDRPRLFETNWPLLVPERVQVADPIGVYGKAPDGRRLFDRKDGSIQRAAASLDEARAAMGIDWMEWRELTQAIPPAYTELVGHQLMQHLRSAAA
jgi:DNA (cytosine-5)-methyltransferase 1